jgi:nucleotide-binding universal stress UspA family protein
MSATVAPGNRILVPISFSEQSLIALGQSYNLARLTNSTLVLLHVVTPESDKDVKLLLEQRAEKVRQEAKVPVEVILEKGNPFKCISDVAKKVNPLFIVIGFSSNITLKKVVGHNIFRLVRESSFPTITIRGKQHNNGCGNILLPLDLTKETREKVNKAIEIAKLFGSTIKVLSVFSSGQRHLENKLISYSHQVRNFIKEKGVPCSIKTVEGNDICSIVLDYANKNDVDLIMIMTKEELSLKEFFVGTTAQQLVDKSMIPVMSIRPVQRRDTTSFTSPY